MLYKLSGSEDEFCLETFSLGLAFSSLEVLDFMSFKPQTIQLTNYEEVKLIALSSFIFEASIIYIFTLSPDETCAIRCPPIDPCLNEVI